MLKYDHTEYERARIQAILWKCYRKHSHKPPRARTVAAWPISAPFKVSDRWIANMSENVVVSSGGDHHSWGGTKAGLPYVESICQAPSITEQGRFEEYARFAEDPLIGNAIVHTEDQAIMLLLAHEVAHALHIDLGRHR